MNTPFKALIVVLASLALTACTSLKERSVISDEQFKTYKITAVEFDTSNAAIYLPSAEASYANSSGNKFYPQPIKLGQDPSAKETEEYNEALQNRKDYEAKIDSPEAKAHIREFFKEEFPEYITPDQFNLSGPTPVTLHIDVSLYSVTSPGDITWENSISLFPGFFANASLRTADGESIQIGRPGNEKTDSYLLTRTVVCQRCDRTESGILKLFKRQLSQSFNYVPE